jgi:hypothetical protein
MKQLTLVRYRDNRVLTQGVLLIDGTFFCDTLERPWKDNQRKVSAIPLGTYNIHYAYHEHNGNTYDVLEVPNRDSILIHSANFVNELEGCIAVGVKSEDAVLHSKDTMMQLVTSLGNTETHSLEIRGI